MTPSLENPFRPTSKRATKRLFRGEVMPNIPTIKAKKEKLEQIKVKYGPHELLQSQVQFLKKLEELITKEALASKNKTARDILIERIEQVENGNIIKLNLSVLNLEELPVLDNLINLQVLLCGSNQLIDLPSLDELINLQQLYCADNKLQKLPNLDKLTNLQNLNCSHNQLQELPSLDKLVNLKKLYCNNNKISTLSEEISQLVNLHILSCDYNQLSKKEEEKIKKLFPFAEV